MSAPIESQEIKIHPLTYYQKPAIGQDNNEDHTPVQVVFPTGGFGLGIMMKNPDLENNTRNQNGNYGVITSAPASTDIDNSEKNGLILTFILLGIVNIILTCLMFGYADSTDSSKIAPQQEYLPLALDKVSSDRRYFEKVGFSFTIIMILVGMISAMCQNALGLSGYCLGIMLNFFLGTSSLPYFVYSFRYILDIAMLYIGLVLRSRFMYTFLPMHIHHH